MAHKTKITTTPTHVAIVMDGNGRWAEQRGLPRLEGHRAGIQNIRRVSETLAEHNVQYLTLYAFSTENWGRPQEEVAGLLQFLSEALDDEVDEFHRRETKVIHLGKLERLPSNIQHKIKEVVRQTEHYTKLTLCIAFDYGGRDEILRAVRGIVEDGVAPHLIEENLFNKYLYIPGIPDPDLFIRTGGEMRLSNFLTWQSAYSELYFTPTYWPDFDKNEVEKSLIAYSKRERRFGKLGVSHKTSKPTSHAEPML